MLDIQTPMDHLYRMNLEIHSEVTGLIEGEWLSPHKDNGNIYVRTTSANAAKDPITTKVMVGFQNWLDQMRPDVAASATNGGGTTVTPFGKYIAMTEVFDHTKIYAAGTALTVKDVNGKSALTPADITAGDVVFATCLSAPATVVSPKAQIQIAVL